MMYNCALHVDPKIANAYKNKGGKYKLIFRNCTNKVRIISGCNYDV